MSTGTMTSKGQITVPKDVRDELGLVPGTKVQFTRNADGDFVLSTVRRPAAALKGRLSYEGPAVSLDDMDAAVVSGAVVSE